MMTVTPNTNTLQNIATLLHTTIHCNTLQHTATHRNTPQHTATHRNPPQHTATHYLFLVPRLHHDDCDSLHHHTATHCNTMQHTATHCTTLHHTATHCNTLQHTTFSLYHACTMMTVTPNTSPGKEWILKGKENHDRKQSSTGLKCTLCVAVCCGVLQCVAVCL